MAAQAEYIEEEPPAEAERRRTRCRAREASIVPADSISGRALLAVIAIMTFLAALTLGAVVLVRSVAGEWQSAVAREITIQLRPSEQPRHRGRCRESRGAGAGDARASPACGPTHGRNPPGCSSPGSAAGLRSASCRCRA